MDYRGLKALVMGLGLHGGGLQSALFLLRRGAEVTVTDLRDEKTLMPSIKELDAACKEFERPIVRYVLGKHEIEDFKKADIVIKNPGVKPDSPFLQVSKQIETDLSLFLTESKARLFAVTGTKGKSGTSSALHWILSKDRKAGKAFLGGNITVSPLTFLEELTEFDDVVLELSSFQLGDIKNYVNTDGQPLLKPNAAILTPIMHDHLDRYASMEDYIDDKKNIYRAQDSNCVTVAGDDDWGKSFLAETKARPLIRSCKRDLSSALGEVESGGCIDSSGRGIARLRGWEGVTEEITELVPQKALTPGDHQKINMLSAALAVFALGVKADTIRTALSTFPGIEHRLEFFHEALGIRYYNDSAATIPEAAAACVEALTDPSLTHGGLILVTGGTDKNLDFSPLARAVKKAKTVILLEGTGSEKLIPLLREAGVSYKGPFDDLDKAVHCAADIASDTDIVALSPGCASFGMFLNEFDRGRKWKEAVIRYCKL
jgi:UDP-N-acetylmuramoylalanine--D-glutamate ligase